MMSWHRRKDHRRTIHRPILTFLAIGLSAWITLPASAPSPHVTRLKTGQPYSLDVRTGRSSSRLQLDTDQRIRLIVGCLGDPGATYPITVEWQPLKPTERGTSDTHPDIVPQPYVFRQPNGRVRLTPDVGTDSASLTGNTPATAVASTPTVLGTTSAPSALSASRSEAVITSTTKTHSDAALDSEHRDFFLHVTDGALDDAQQYCTVHSRLIDRGQHVRVYLDQQQDVDELAAGLATEIVRLFEHEVLPGAVRQIGGFHDVDRDGTFAILLTPWLQRLQGGQTSLGGFVRSSDFRTTLAAPFSNHCDMLYLNSNVQPGLHLRNLLAHEFTHAVCFSQRIAGDRTGPAVADEEDWLNEAIAHQFETGWTNLDYRISRYLNEPGSYPLVVRDYYRAGMWRNHGCRGATFLFLRWCRQRFGDDILSALVHQRLSGIRNLERATGVDFEDLFRQWTLAVAGIEVNSTTTACDSNGPSVFQAIMSAGFGTDNSASTGQGSRSNRVRSGPDGAAATSLEKWGIAGPRKYVLPAKVDARKTIHLRGTAAAFFELTVDADSGDVGRLTITAGPAARLQVSLIAVPDFGPSPSITAEWYLESNDNRSSPGPESNWLDEQPEASRMSPRPQICVTVAHGTETEVARIVCERDSNATRDCCSLAGDQLVARQIRLTPEVGKRSNHSTASCYVIDTPDFVAGETVIVKVLTQDAAGRKRMHWHELQIPGLRVTRRDDTVRGQE